MVEVLVIRDNEGLLFVTEDGDKYYFYHEQECCESVDIDDIVGNLNDLVGSPILIAEGINNVDLSPQVNRDESYTWTFYKFSTIKGSVTVKWYGQSNGYYSERVDFKKL